MIKYFKEYNRERIESISTLKKFANCVYNNNSYEISSLMDDLAKLASDGLVEALIQYELDKLENNIRYTPNPSAFTFINLLDCKHASLSLIYSKGEDFTARSRSSSHSADRLLMSLTKKDVVKYKLYEQTTPYPQDILDRSKKLKFIKKSNLRFGEPILLKKNVDILKFDEKGDKNIVLLILFSKNESSYIWEYQNKTNIPDKLVTGNHYSSRLEHTCRLLGELGDVNSIPYLEKFLEHNEFNVRWEAVKSIMLISYEKGIETLEKVINDPHPEIRKLALNSLSKLNKY